jgi:hypothetical protein
LKHVNAWHLLIKLVTLFEKGYYRLPNRQNIGVA